MQLICGANITVPNPGKYGTDPHEYRPQSCQSSVVFFTLSICDTYSVVMSSSHVFEILGVASGAYWRIVAVCEMAGLWVIYGRKVPKTKLPHLTPLSATGLQLR